MNHWERTFQNDEVCLHVIRPSRGKDVIREVLDGHCPEVWISHLFSAQKTHPAEDWQVSSKTCSCCGHVLKELDLFLKTVEKR